VHALLKQDADTEVKMFLMADATRSTMAELAEATVRADKVRVF